MFDLVFVFGNYGTQPYHHLLLLSVDGKLAAVRSERLFRSVRRLDSEIDSRELMTMGICLNGRLIDRIRGRLSENWGVFLISLKKRMGVLDLIC